MMLEGMKTSGGEQKKLAGQLKKEVPSNVLTASALRTAVEALLVKYAVQVAHDTTGPIVEKRLAELAPTSVAGTLGKPLFSKREKKTLRDAMRTTTEDLLTKEIHKILKGSYDEVGFALLVPGTVKEREEGDDVTFTTHQENLRSHFLF